jgi:hypothetical protein
MRNDPLTDKQRRILEEIRSYATMESASFSRLWSDPDDPLPKTEAEVTEFIRRRTAIYRQTWILDYLDELLAHTVGGREDVGEPHGG